MYTYARLLESDDMLEAYSDHYPGYDRQLLNDPILKLAGKLVQVVNISTTNYLLCVGIACPKFAAEPTLVYSQYPIEGGITKWIFKTPATTPR